MIVWLICESEWIRNFLKVKWEGIKGLSQPFTFGFYDPGGNKMTFKYFQILFITKPWREDDMTSSIWMTRGVENIWISFENISNSETLCNSMIFTSEDKMTSSNYVKYELGVSKDRFQSPVGINFQFGVIWVLFKLFFSKIKIYRN